GRGHRDPPENGHGASHPDVPVPEDPAHTIWSHIRQDCGPPFTTLFVTAAIARAVEGSSINYKMELRHMYVNPNKGRPCPVTCPNPAWSCRPKMSSARSRSGTRLPASSAGSTS